jgi:hypothetical protein
MQNDLERMNTPVQIITFNTLQPPYTITNNMYGKLKQLPGYSDRYERAQALCDKLQNYDICCLQNFNYDALDKFPNYTIKGIPEAPPGRVARLVQSYNYANPNGGLVSIYKRNMRIIWHDEHILTTANTDIRSFSFTLLDMNMYWRGKYLLICNVHLASDNAHEDSIVRELQRGEIFDEFRKLHTKLFPLGFKWENCGVIMAGTLGCTDSVVSIFNVDDDNIEPISVVNIEYKKLMECFGEANDILAKHPTNTYDIELNQYATEKSARVDYLIALDSIPSAVCFDYRTRGTGPCKTMQLQVMSAAVLTDIELSDHFPVVATLVPRTNRGSNVGTNFYSKNEK